MLACRGPRLPGRLPLQAWAAGAVLFPCSLYALALGAPAAFALVTPIGGVCLLAGLGGARLVRPQGAAGVTSR